MTQSMQIAQQFDLALSQYKRISTLGWLFLLVLILIIIVCIALGIWLWGRYAHNFTLYLKWQDALLSLSWFIAFVALAGTVLVGRFLSALRRGYTHGMIILLGNTISVRDLSSENFGSIFWFMNSAFWCFIAVLVGLSPGMLIGWTLHLPSSLLVITATSFVVILGLAGLVISIVAFSFIVIGCFGFVSFCRKLGAAHSYELDGRTNLSIDNFVLAIVQSGRAQSMIDLRLLSVEDQKRLLLQLRNHWNEAAQKWSPDFGAEVAQVLEAIQV